MSHDGFVMDGKENLCHEKWRCPGLNFLPDWFFILRIFIFI